MWPFRKSAPATKVLTLKQRVDEFWIWFETNASRFYDTIDDKRCGDLTNEVSTAVNRWFPGMAWVFGPGAHGIGHSFTLTGEAVLPKQFVTQYWLGRAPQIDGWTFYSTRQADTAPGHFAITLCATEEKFRPIEFWVSPYIDEQDEKIDLAVWHPSINRVSERDRFTALFLILDELLGEIGTQRWIREIKFSENSLQKSMPIPELVEFVQSAQSLHAWKQYHPTETWIGYRMRERSGEWLRSDTVAGSSRYFKLVGAYLDTEGPCEHPLPDFGIDYVFATIPTSYFEKGSEVDGRTEIEDEIITHLERAGTGISIGGATGVNNCYMDFALYDGPEGLEIIRTIMRKHRVSKASKIYFFTADRGKDVIPVW